MPRLRTSKLLPFVAAVAASLLAGLALEPALALTMLPFLALVSVLLLGRFPGEEAIEKLAAWVSRDEAHRSSHDARPDRSGVRDFVRRILVTDSIAPRGPPSPAQI